MHSPIGRRHAGIHPSPVQSPKQACRSAGNFSEAGNAYSAAALRVPVGSHLRQPLAGGLPSSAGGRASYGAGVR